MTDQGGWGGHKNTNMSTRDFERQEHIYRPKSRNTDETEGKQNDTNILL